MATIRLGSNVRALPKLANAAEDVVLLTKIWTDFAHCTYVGDNIEEFCAKYRTALDKCNAADIIIPDKIQALHFIGILNGHFPQWGANKREAMRRDVLPSLDQLMHEIVDESRVLDRIKQQRMLQVFHFTQSSSPVHIAVPRFKVNKRGRHEIPLKKATCNHCGLSHLEDKCWYIYIELRPEGWQPNTLIQQQINERLGRITNQSNDLFGASLTMSLLNHAFDCTEEQRSDLWIAASGCTHHCCNNKDLFLEYVDNPVTIGSVISSGSGQIKLTLRQSFGVWLPITLSNVRYTPTATLNTISEHLLGKRGVYWRGEQSKFIHLATGRELAPVTVCYGLKVFTVQ